MESKTKLKINHLRLSPEPPDSRVSVDSVCRNQGKDRNGLAVAGSPSTSASRICASSADLSAEPPFASPVAARRHAAARVPSSTFWDLGEVSTRRRRGDAAQPAHARAVRRRSAAARHRARRAGGVLRPARASSAPRLWHAAGVGVEAAVLDGGCRPGRRRATRLRGAPSSPVARGGLATPVNSSGASATEAWLASIGRSSSSTRGRRAASGARRRAAGLPAGPRAGRARSPSSTC